MDINNEIESLEFVNELLHRGNAATAYGLGRKAAEDIINKLRKEYIEEVYNNEKV